MEDRTFATGMFVKLPSENAPSFVKMRLGFKVADFAAFLSQHEKGNGFVDVDILESKDGSKLYGVLNTYQPEKPESLKEDVVEGDEGIDIDAIPF
jgi:hypothetical protein